jgi:hypothetical protein
MEQELPTTPIPNQTPTNLAKHNKQPAVWPEEGSPIKSPP